jgi:hypothetical protein
MGSQDFAMHFLDEVLFQNMAHIDDLPLLGDTQVALGILSSCVICRPSYLTWTVPLLFLIFLRIFDRKIIEVCGDITGP